MTNLRRISVTISRWIACSAVALLLPAIGPASAEEICKNRFCATSTDAPNPNGGWAVHVRLRPAFGAADDHYNVLAPGAEQFEVGPFGEFDFLVPPGGTTEYSVQTCFTTSHFGGSKCDPWETFNHSIVAEPSGSASGSAFCQEYADTAVAQVARSQQMQCGFDGDRWNPDWAAHNNWCIGFDGAEGPPTTEALWRIRDLQDCSARVEAAKEKGILQNPGAAAGLFKKEVTPATPPPPPAGNQTAKVIKPVEVFDDKGGGGNRIGELQEGDLVELAGPCDDFWCNVLGPAVPAGNGWVWDGPEYDSLEF